LPVAICHPGVPSIVKFVPLKLMRMDSLTLLLVGLSALIWLIILLLPWQPWRNTETLEMDHQGIQVDLSDITVVIPARDESGVIQTTLAALVEQGDRLRVILVDDCSTDGTSGAALQVQGVDLSIISGAALPPGWSGKLWALEQGVRQVDTRLTLLLDADIKLGQGVLGALKEKMLTDGTQFVSIMASLRMVNFWEKLLMPAFIYFFKLLYPFRLTNSQNTHFSSAAGGCILLETRLFEEIGGLEAIKDAVIDDCTLAREVKRRGHRMWIGQSRAVESVRVYEDLGVIWDMIARSAFSQLNYSILILTGLTLVMGIMFWAPVLGTITLNPAVLLLSITAYLAMIISYLPTIRYYGLKSTWALLMPVIGTLYLAMTWSSAFRFWRGERTRWKSRVYR